MWPPIRRRAVIARRWFPDYPGELPTGTLPADWLAARAP